MALKSTEVEEWKWERGSRRRKGVVGMARGSKILN